jgi:hypothetical protein
MDTQIDSRHDEEDGHIPCLLLLLQVLNAPAIAFITHSLTPHHPILPHTCIHTYIHIPTLTVIHTHLQTTTQLLAFYKWKKAEDVAALAVGVVTEEATVAVVATVGVGVGVAVAVVATRRRRKAGPP